MQPKENFWGRLCPKLPRVYVRTMTAILLCAALALPAMATNACMKRETIIETDRDIINKSTVLTADKHYVAYLYDSSKAIKIKETVSTGG